MGCYIKKYEALSQVLGLPENLTIVRNGFSKFYGKPSNDCSLELCVDLLKSLNLEVAFADSVNEFNAIYKHHETQFSISIIDWMKIDHLNYMDHNDNEYEPPYRYTLLDNWLKETRTNSILDDYYIISMEDAHKYRLLLDYVYCEPVLAELNLVRVKKTIYHNRFNPVVNRNFTGIVSFMEVDVNSTGKLQALFPSIHINYGELAKAAQKLKKSIKSLSKEIALTTKGYYLDMEDGVLTVADTQMGKPDTDINRIAMEFAIREIFDEIEHTTGHSELIAGELCESSPYVIVNIGSVNIDSKKEPCPTYDKLLADRITKALKSLVD